MYRKAVQYKGLWLAPGSLAIELYYESKFKELDLLIKQVLQKEEGSK